MPVGRAPAALERCMQPPGQGGRKGYGVTGGCGAAGMLFAGSTANGSYGMSRQLLQVRALHSAICLTDGL